MTDGPPWLRRVYEPGWLEARLVCTIDPNGWASEKVWRRILDERWWGPKGDFATWANVPSFYRDALDVWPPNPRPDNLPPISSGSPFRPPFKNYVGTIGRLELADRPLLKSNIDGSRALQALTEDRLDEDEADAIRKAGAVIRAMQGDSPSLGTIISAADETLRRELWETPGCEPGSGKRGLYVVGQFNDALIGGFAPGSPTVLRGNGHKDSDTAWDGVLAPEEQFRPPSDLPPSDQFRRDEEASRVSVHGGSAERLDDNADPGDAVIEGDAARPTKHHALPAQTDIGWQDPTFDECLSDLLYDAIQLAIDRLAESDPEAHQVFELVRRDWTQPKIAAELGESTRTVRRRLRDARRQLQADLEAFRDHLMLDPRYGTYRWPIREWGQAWADYEHLGTARQEIPLHEREELCAWRVRIATDGTPNESGEKSIPTTTDFF